MPMLSDKEKRLVLRGMSLARGVLKALGECSHHEAVLDYQEIMADAWGITGENYAREKDEFEMLIDEINDAISAKHPNWVNRVGQKWPRN
jgi:hypothetical protein